MCDICMCASMGCVRRGECLRAVIYNDPNTKLEACAISNFKEYCSDENDYKYYISCEKGGE